MIRFIKKVFTSIVTASTFTKSSCFRVTLRQKKYVDIIIQKGKLLPPESEVGDQAMGEGGCGKVPASAQQRVKGVRRTVQT